MWKLSSLGEKTFSVQTHSFFSVANAMLKVKLCCICKYNLKTIFPKFSNLQRWNVY